MPDYAASGSEQPAARPARRHVRRGRGGGRDRVVRPRPRRGARRPQRSTACSTWSWSNSGRTARLWRNVGAGDAPGAGADGPLAGGPARASRAPNRDAIGGWLETRTSARARSGGRSRSAAATSAASSAGSISGSGRRTEAEVRVTWPDGEVGPWIRLAPPNAFVRHRARRRPPSDRGSRPPRDREAPDDRRRAWPRSSCPDFGVPDGTARDPGRDVRRRVDALRERASARGYDRLVVYADREHSANLSFLTGFDPRFEEARPRRRADRRAGHPASATSATGTAGAAPLPMRRHRFQDFSLPSQPRDRSRPLADDPRRRGDRAGHVASASSAGRRTPTARGWRSRRSSSTSCAGCRSERARRERQRPADRPGRRPAGHQRRRPARRLRVRGVPTSNGVRELLFEPPARAARARGGPPPRLERDAAVVPPDADRRSARDARPAQPGRPAHRARATGSPPRSGSGARSTAAPGSSSRTRASCRTASATTSSGSSGRTSRPSSSGTRRSTSARPAARCRRSSTASWATRSSASS